MKQTVQKIIEILIQVVGVVFGFPAWVFKLLPKKFQGYKTFIASTLGGFIVWAEVHDLTGIIDATVVFLAGVFPSWGIDAEWVKSMYTLLLTGIGIKLRLDSKTAAFLDEEKNIEQIVEKNYDMVALKMTSLKKAA